MENSKEELSRSESALITTLGYATIQRATTLVGEMGMVANHEQQIAMGAFIRRIVVGTVVGLRDPGPVATGSEIAQVVEEIAQTAVMETVGLPPSLRGYAS